MLIEAKFSRKFRVMLEFIAKSVNHSSCPKYSNVSCGKQKLKKFAIFTAKISKDYFLLQHAQNNGKQTKSLRYDATLCNIF